MAAAPPGRELCPHCGRPFKRLRSHLPHCKAAPSPVPRSAPGASQSPGRAAAPRNGSGPDGAAPAAGPREGEAGKSSTWLPGEEAAEPGPRPRPRPDGRRAERQAEPAVRDVAESLDLLPEEVTDIPETLSRGVEIVIEKHRARVVRERSGARSGDAPPRSRRTDGPAVERPDGGGGADTAQPEPRERAAIPGSAQAETCGLGAAEKAAGSSKGGKGNSSKATKIKNQNRDPPGPACRNSPGDLGQQEGTAKTAAGEKRMYPEVGVECKTSLSALHTKNLHLPVTDHFRGHNEGAPKNYLTGTQKLGESKKQMAVVYEPILNARRGTKLAPDQFLLHTSKSQPICLSQVSGRSTPAGAMGLEWFPDLYPGYDGLSIFPGKPFQQDMGITMKTPKGNFSEGQQGPLSERRLMDVRLGELPAWLATCDLSLQGLRGGVQKAWSSYYNKYINVKRGGPAGISMLLAGYCLLSYGWNYQHIKCHRWRKYH